jgi:predicted transcriptional regulator
MAPEDATYQTLSMPTITFRTDDDVDRALADLTSGDRGRSQVIREAILAAWRARRDEQLRAEAEEVAADADDRAEARAVLVDMESLRAR